MPCAAPITVSSPAGPIQVRCKQCLQCRIMKQSSLTLRCLLENQCTLSGEFLTLTYADAPEVLDFSDFQTFLKRLRMWNHRRGNRVPIRFLACGEYGSKTHRAHFHALIWNALPLNSDRCLTTLWPQGFSYTGTITPASIRYTARYTLKFQHKGEEAKASWSRGSKPTKTSPGSLPLGCDGIMQLASYMRNNGYKIPATPTLLTIDGKKYPLDQTLKNYFQKEYESCGQKIPQANSAFSHLQYLFEKKYGDPTNEQRKLLETKARFFEMARFSNETF